MSRFFVSKSQIKGDHVTIMGGDANHISRVLRMKTGDGITVCDGRGNDFEAIITSAEKEAVSAKIIKSYRCDSEPDTDITLFQALPKQGKMEYIIQKNTELGIMRIVPVYSKRCVSKPTDKLERWRRVALEAAKQCGRGIVPEVCETVSFNDALLQMTKLPVCAMFWEEERNLRIKDVFGNVKSNKIGILIGPEGGFEPDEAEYAKSLGIPTVSLGKRILRTETAGAAVVPIIMYLQSDI
ncbi:MAG: Ribosomal RNA small subunit methyltransferase E [Firmicutes bacterium ADurb.Bin193]|nr:MAG: Ribosomal RNA small subunit methyltransferase E [Firmicutes bacterium ADurb.Bin193]